MSALIGNILVALAWMAITGDFTVANFGAGMLIGLGALWLIGDIIGAADYVRRVGAAARLLSVFMKELTIASARVAHDVVTPRIRARPMILGFDLTAQSDLEILLLSMLITLTPGSVVVHITEDRKRMYVYTMYGGDAEAQRASIRRTFERRVLQVTRGASQ